jgi:hypothetical protein
MLKWLRQACFNCGTGPKVDDFGRKRIFIHFRPNTCAKTGERQCHTVVKERPKQLRPELAEMAASFSLETASLGQH